MTTLKGRLDVTESLGVGNANLNPSALTSGRTISFQDKDGTLATTTDNVLTTPILEADFMDGIPSGWTYSRAGSATYINSSGVITTATTDTPRYERDPVTGKKLGLLIEKERTNLYKYSQKFDEADWLKYQTSVSQEVADGTSPTGETWWRMTEDTSNNEHSCRQIITLAPGSHTISVMVKDGGTMGQFILSALSTSPAGYAQVAFDTVTHRRIGSYFSTPLFGEQRSDVRQITSDTWIYSTTFNVNNGTNVTAEVGLMGGNDGGGVGGFYTGTSRYIIFAYQQAEKGQCRTSYIPTTSTTATRPRDILYRDLSSVPNFSQLSGTMMAEITPLTGPSNFTTFVDINGQDGAYAYIDLTQASDRFKMQFWDNNADVILGTVDYSYRAGVTTRLVAAWKDQNFAFAEAGLIDLNHLGGLTPQTLSRINIGHTYVQGGSEPDNKDGHFCIRQLRLYGTRLSDNEVVALSMFQDSAVRSDKLYRIGVGPSSTSTNLSYLLDVNPGTNLGKGVGIVNIRSVLNASRPVESNLFPYGLLVQTDSSIDFTPVGTSTRYVSSTGINATAARNNANDIGTQSNNGLVGGSFAANHGTTLNMTAYSGITRGLLGSSVCASGTINNQYGLTGATTINGSTTGPKQGYVATSYTGYLTQSVVSGGTGATAYAGHAGTAYGLYINQSTTITGTNGTIGTAYGLYLNSQPAMTTINSTAVNTAFATTTTITRDTGSWLDDGFAVDQFIAIEGSASTGNNKKHKITAVDATTITCAASTFTVTGAATGVYIGANGGVVKDKWAIYQAGTSDKNYLGGTLRIGGGINSRTSNNEDIVIDNGNAVSKITIGTYQDASKDVSIENENGKMTIKATNSAGSQSIALNVNAADALRIDASGDTLVAGKLVMSNGLTNAADDAAAASAGVPVNGLYRNGSVVMIRVS